MRNNAFPLDILIWKNIKKMLYKHPYADTVMKSETLILILKAGVHG